MAININQSGQVSGFYHDITVVRNAGKPNEHVETYCAELPSKNLLTDGMFTRWLAGTLRDSQWRFFVGTGTTTPLVTDNQLQNQTGAASGAATVTVNAVVNESGNYISSGTGVGEWPVGGIVANISEIGCSLQNSTTGTLLDSRALIVDGLGNPTSITVTADDQLIVSYTLRYRIPIAQHISTVDFDGVSTQCTLETLGVFNNFHWGLGVVLDAGYPFRPGTQMRISNTANLRNNVESDANFGTSAFVSLSGASFEGKRRVILSASSSQFNQVGDIKYMLIMSAGGLARQGILFDPPLAKTNTKSLVLNFDYTLTRA